MALVEVGAYSYERRVKHESGIESSQVISVPAHRRKKPVRKLPDNQPQLVGFGLIEGQMSIYDVPGV